MPASTTPGRWADWREPGPKPPDDIIFLYGASHKAYHVLTCDDVHHGPMPDGSECMCGVCLTSGPRVEDAIAASNPRAPTEPETRLAAIKACLADRADPVPARYVPALELAVAELEAVIDAGITPTRYVPDAKLRGGRG